jgi:hypothetical protein
MHIYIYIYIYICFSKIRSAVVCGGVRLSDLKLLVYGSLSVRL